MANVAHLNRLAASAINWPIALVGSMQPKMSRNGWYTGWNQRMETFLTIMYLSDGCWFRMDS